MHLYFPYLHYYECNVILRCMTNYFGDKFIFHIFFSNRCIRSQKEKLNYMLLHHNYSEKWMQLNISPPVRGLLLDTLFIIIYSLVVIIKIYYS